MIDLSPAHLAIVKRILAEHVSECGVWAFGSRATWNAKDHSDLDLAVVGDGPLPRGTLARLKESFEESTLPMRVDVLDWHDISESFRKVIKRHYAVAQEGVPPDRRRTVALGDVAEIVMGQSPPGDSVSADHGVPLLNGPTEFGAHHPTPEQYTTDPRKLARTGDLLFCVRGSTTGRMNWADQEYAIGRGVAAIRHRDEPALQPFVRGAIEVELPELLTQATGSTFPNISARQLAAVPYPNLRTTEQRAIARVLGALDDKIELNRRMSATLEAMARALFKSWFVDFEPVRAKMEGRPSGLPPALDALFPASFEASELGQIPSGWGVRSLDRVAETVRGRSYRSAELAESDTALVTLKSFARGGGYRPDGLKPYTGKYKPAQIVGPGELVIACTDVTQAAEVVGRPAIVPADQRFTALVASLDTLIIRPRDVSAAPVPFLYCLTSEPSFTQHTYAHVSGTTVLHLSKEAVPAFKFALPPSDLMRAFIGLAGPAFKRMTDLSGESAATAAQRDALLPRLVSGEVRIAPQVASRREGVR